MAGLITHMVVAREIMKLLPEGTIRDQGLFYLGNLAPDAIHAREGYIREYKKHTHFRDNIKDMEFEQEENQISYRERLTEFITKHKVRTDGLYDLYLGYASHILTDELFVKTVRKEFCEVMEGFGIAQNDHRFFEYIVNDMNRNDLLLVKRYEDMEEVKSQVERVTIYPIDDLLSYQEMKICMDWLIHWHFYEEQEELSPVYISYERTVAFIQAAAISVVTRLSEKESPLRML